MLIMIQARPLEWPVDAWMLEKKCSFPGGCPDVFAYVSRWCSCQMSCITLGLWLEAIGAFGVVIWMIVWFLCLHMQNDGRYEPRHWTMWAFQEDRGNMAARLLFALLEFILGIVRAFAIAYWNSAGMLWLVAATYTVLGVFFLGLVLYRRVAGWFLLVSLDAFIFAVLAALVALEK